ncbi:MAG: protein kinase [Planctomycetota bacterium]
MPDAPMMPMPPACTLCGESLGVNPSTGVCASCVEEISSVVMIPDVSSLPVEIHETHAHPLPESFGDYEILLELAQGGMGVIYVARQISLNRRVALKMMRTRMALPQQIRRFQAEAENAATLDHPNIVPIYDSGSTEGVPYFTMKLIEGRSLNAELRRLVLEPRKSVAIMAQIARAVQFAHERGILHRDLKPANILIDEQGVPYIGDFGISKRVGTTDGMTREGVVMGTPYYMPPEQANGQTSTLTTAADVYGLGAIFYEVLTLRAPFHDSDPDDVLRKVKTEDPVAPRSLRQGIDRDLETICLKCLEKSPARRYASAEAFALDLDCWLRGEPISARPHTSIERAIKFARRRPGFAGAVAMVVVFVALVSGFYWHSRELIRHSQASQLSTQHHAAEKLIQRGLRSLINAEEAHAANRTIANEDALIEAEDCFRSALVNWPDNKVAIDGLRDTALISFDASLRSKNFRQAREKLQLARTARLSTKEMDQRQDQLTRLESERGNTIRARVTALMADAASLTRATTHENAVYELIALKDPIAVESLTQYVNHERSACRRLAFDALAWMGDVSLVALIRPHIQPRTPGGRDNPLATQVSAIVALCKLAGDDDIETYMAIKLRIAREPGDSSSLLFHNIKHHHAEFARRQARHFKDDREGTSAKLAALAMRFTDAGSFRDALELYDQLVNAEPENIEYRNLRGLARRYLNDSSGAVADFDLVVNRLPKQKDGYVNRSVARRDLNDLTGALADLDKAVELDPNDTALLSTRGTVRMQKGDVAGAMADFDSALKINKDELYALANRASARAGLKDFAGALSDFDRALALSPMFREALTGRACTRMELNDVDGAISDFEKTLVIDPGQKNCYYNRAVLRMSKRDYREAVRDFDYYIEMDPKLAAAFYNRAICKSNLGDGAAAAKDYQSAIGLDPTRADAMVNLGNYYLNKNEPNEAMKLYDRAITVNPKKFEAWSCRGDLRFALGQLELGIQDKRMALSLLPANAPKAKRDDVEQAIKEMEAARKN